MDNRERFLGTMRYQPVDRRPLHVVGWWPDTLARWRREGLPAEVEDVHAYLGVSPVRLINVCGVPGWHPPFESCVLREEKDFVVSIDTYGRTVRTFRDHTSMPEWIDFPVKSGDDLRRVLHEHFDVTNLDARFPAEWEVRIATARETPDALILLDGGCYYWALRSVAGVEQASYLLYDATDTVEELFERYFTVVMEGLRRVTPRIRVDVIGFGEDIAFKTGPLMSPEMFRRLILPRYRKAMAFAHEKGIDLTWYDSDGDLRLLIPDYLSVGINTVAPCEVAASMDPVALRRAFGRELRMIGGFDKRVVARGPAAIDAEFQRLRPVIAEGGFLPAIDHSVSADISWDHYRYFMDAACRACQIKEPIE
jgi:uroporphyrinogen decarboxylase